MSHVSLGNTLRGSDGSVARQLARTVRAHILKEVV